MGSDFSSRLTSNPKEMAWPYEFKLWTTVVCGLFSVCENLLRYYNSSLLNSCENLVRCCVEGTCVKAKPTPEQWYHQHQKGNSFVMFKVWGKKYLTRHVSLASKQCGAGMRGQLLRKQVCNCCVLQQMGDQKLGEDFRCLASKRAHWPLFRGPNRTWARVEGWCGELSCQTVLRSQRFEEKYT